MRCHFVVGVALAAAVSAFAIPGYAATPDEAKALSEKASAYIKQAGQEKAFADSRLALWQIKCSLLPGRCRTRRAR
jgi:hypothetical protein